MHTNAQAPGPARLGVALTSRGLEANGPSAEDDDHPLELGLLRVRGDNLQSTVRAGGFFDRNGTGDVFFWAFLSNGESSSVQSRDSFNGCWKTSTTAPTWTPAPISRTPPPRRPVSSYYGSYLLWESAYPLIDLSVAAGDFPEPHAPRRGGALHQRPRAQPGLPALHRASPYLPTIAQQTLREMREAHPEDWEKVQHEIADVVNTGDIDDLKACVQRVSQGPLGHNEIQSAMAAEALRKVCVAAATQASPGARSVSTCGTAGSPSCCSRARGSSTKPISSAAFRLIGGPHPEALPDAARRAQGSTASTRASWSRNWRARSATAHRPRDRRRRRHAQPLPQGRRRRRHRHRRPLVVARDRPPDDVLDEDAHALKKRRPRSSSVATLPATASVSLQDPLRRALRGDREPARIRVRQLERVQQPNRVRLRRGPALGELVPRPSSKRRWPSSGGGIERRRVTRRRP